MFCPCFAYANLSFKSEIIKFAFANLVLRKLIVSDILLLVLVKVMMMSRSLACAEAKFVRASTVATTPGDERSVVLLA